MAKYSPLFCLVLAALGLLARAGDNEARPPLRKEFRQQAQYPYVFEPVAYLENQGPAPMRFGPPMVDCSHHTPPHLPAAKPSPSPSPTPEPKKEKTAAPVDNTGQKPQTPPPTEQKPAPSAAAYPPPQGAPTPPAPDNVDFNQMPDEVLEFFKNPYNSVPNGHRLFDPIFEPALMHTAPRSKATYHQE